MTELTEGLPTPEKPAAAALALRLKALKRGRIVVEYANRGVPIPEIAARIGVADSEARAMLRDALVRSLPETPEEFAAIQMSRLNEALLVSYSAMGDMNLKAVDRVVRIVRALDRYYAVVAARPLTLAPAEDRAAAPAAALAPPSETPERSPIAAEPVEMMRSRSLSELVEFARSEGRAARPADAPAPRPVSDRPGARPGIPPQPIEMPRFGRGFAAQTGPVPERAALGADGREAPLDRLGLLHSRRPLETASSIRALAAAGA